MDSEVRCGSLCAAENVATVTLGRAVLALIAVGLGCTAPPATSEGASFAITVSDRNGSPQRLLWVEWSGDGGSRVLEQTWFDAASCCGRVAWSTDGLMLGVELVDAVDDPVEFAWGDVEPGGASGLVAAPLKRSSFAFRGPALLGLGAGDSDEETRGLLVDLEDGEVGELFVESSRCSGVHMDAAGVRMAYGCTDSAGASLVVRSVDAPGQVLARVDIPTAIGPVVQALSPEGGYSAWSFGDSLWLTDLETGESTELPGFDLAERAGPWLDEERLVAVDAAPGQVVVLDATGAELNRSEDGGFNDAFVVGSVVLAAESERPRVRVLDLELRELDQIEVAASGRLGHPVGPG